MVYAWDNFDGPFNVEVAVLVCGIACLPLCLWWWEGCLPASLELCG